MDELKEVAKKLAEKALFSTDSGDAMRFAQAALNVAHAWATFNKFESKN